MVMLDPNQRRLLTEVLQPPEGYELDEAIACTYSLDLLALASVPLLSLGHEVSALDEGEAEVGQQLAGIECVRRSMDKFTVFCQAGAIHVPPEAKALFVWLESSVVEVTPPAGRQRAVFHPKLWILRFSAGRAVRYRVVVLSRNLTFDRSWDVLAVLEGDLQKQRDEEAARLADFVGKLGTYIPAKSELSDRNARRVARFRKELANVSFSVAGDEVKWRFWPLGVKATFDSTQLFSHQDSPFRSWASKARLPGRQLLVVSPFLGKQAVQTLVRLSSTCPVHLVSDEHVLDQFSSCAVEGPEGLGQGRVWSFQSHDPTDQLAGLHAKLWVADDGYEAHMWLGSANATDAAFGRNVEFLLELQGKKSVLGTQTLLAESNPQSREERVFRDLLVPYTAPLEPSVVASDAARQRKLDFRLKELVAQGLSATFASTSDGYQLSLQLRAPDSVVVRPISVAEDKALTLVGGSSTAATFGGLAMHDLTEFWVITLTDKELVARCATRVATHGMPDLLDRGRAVLSRHLQNMDALSQYLGFLLAEGAEGLRASIRSGKRGKRSKSSHDKPKPLLETLMHALVKQPHILDDLDALLRSVGEDGATWLEDASFQELWAAIRSAKQQLQGALA